VITIELFTDPACPFAFSAEPVRQRLRWHYGDQLQWTTRMIVLTRESGEDEKLAEGAPGLQESYGMPINPAPYPRPASSEPACRAFIAARLYAPERADTLLRHLRISVMQGGLLDEPELIAAAATATGLDAHQLAAWSATKAVSTALEADAAAARDPAPAARALDHKLGGPPAQRRYTAPSYLIDGYAIPGFNPIEVYETAIANRAPRVERRPPPATIPQLLQWADEPLATAEIALIMQTDHEQTRHALREVANWQPAGADGYWTLPDQSRSGPHGSVMKKVAISDHFHQ
jgi:predicted DsbA family dithiol-disulfide isomerase